MDASLSQSDPLMQTIQPIAIQLIYLDLQKCKLANLKHISIS